MRTTFKCIVIAATSLSLCFASRAALVIDLDGATQFDAWNVEGLSSATNPGFPGFPGSGAWPNAIESNVSGSGDSALTKVSGSAYPAGGSIYFGGFSSTPNLLGGTLMVSDATPLAGLQNLVFQVEIGEAFTYDFYNHQLPVLTLYDGATVLATGLSATYSALLGQVFNGTTRPTEKIRSVRKSLNDLVKSGF